MAEKGSRKDKNQNIQVFVRLRPLNQREKDIRSLGVIEVANGREVIVRLSQNSLHTKKFTFDRAFPPNSKQVEIYQEVVSPLIEEVLAGYNCTVFAYGQTGTGKTHTMVGEPASNETTWQNDPQAGIIPRALSQLFDELRLSNSEYTVRVSYLELYNEELFDLLSTSEDNSKLRIYEDVSKKGANIVNGLEEITVYNKNEVYKIMSQGQERKKVASTLMNSQSSRSHTVFTIVVHMKDNSSEGEELVRIGKLNLVDLAGSENISKAGSDNPAKRERARECVNINQSLLTLGRVITALVERHPHIPYRESKLTRILQESLGGRTKTSIIATVSPGHKDLEETMSTLDYANRAKNIQNKPEINQKMTKKAVLKEYAEEIDRLKRDIIAAREKNGVFLSHETYNDLTFKQEEQRKEVQELLLRKKALEEERDKMEQLFEKQNQELQQKGEMLMSTNSKLHTAQQQLADTANMLKTTKLHFEEQRHLVEKQRETEHVLQEQARNLLNAARSATCDVDALLDNLDKRRSLENNNLEVTRAYRDTARQHRDTLASTVDAMLAYVNQALLHVHDHTEKYLENNTQGLSHSKQKAEAMMHSAAECLSKMFSIRDSIVEDIETEMSKNKEQIQTSTANQENDLHALIMRFSESQSSCLEKASQCDVRGDLDKFLQYWHSSASSKVCSLGRRAGGVAQAGRQHALERGRAARSLQQRATERRTAFEHRVRRWIEDITQEKQNADARISKQFERIKKEKIDLENQLTAYIEEKQREIQNYVEAQRNLLEERQQERIQEIEDERQEYERRVEKGLTWLQNELKENECEIEELQEVLVSNENEIDSHVVVLNRFETEYKTESAAVSRDLDELSEAALKVVDNVKVQLVSSLQAVREDMQKESQQALSSNSEAMARLRAEAAAAMDHVSQHSRQAMHHLLRDLQTHTDNLSLDLQQLSSGSSELICLCELHKNTQDEALMNLQKETARYTDTVKSEVETLAQIEDRCLNEQYAVYSPTGATPGRKEYRYPESLAATSPHERILARFRAGLQQTMDDVIVIDDGGEDPSPSDDSSCTEDSAASAGDVSGPASPAPPAPPAMLKCTSDTNIVVNRQLVRKHSKENANQSMCLKKQSKLPALSAHKKPLLDRNVDN
ncbi:kinesin-like protein Klp61F [Leptidea sinapis]|uniref:kinesin-like protein Klp61F n=1 Tax=Leptidea sinapis TaxID=189913 RepID=UPI002141BC15|nr:kinesin-like protein Klp61F [Leptidea sinapis]